MRNDDFEVVYNMYYQQLFLYARSLTSNKEDAKDVLANAFVKAYLSFSGGNVRAWLYKVVRNECYNLYREKKHEINLDVSLIELMGSEDSILGKIITDEKKAWLYKKILELKPRDREIMLLSLKNELTDKEISIITNVSLENVRVIKHRVKMHLMENAKEDYHE
ncbi:MAG: sigma-70 family RNA polymerase sigma factor [Erysipelotrichaceae bacterium]|nr:sigma-70 family RNA polymerase sigma factor [Erysipelotrichaceae bacterium]MDD3809965.1 sigma-70 family RNA polymerase sigma factor [Erysipelotrichaceae bacterium]